MPKSTALSTTARTLLAEAAGREDRVVFPPERLPIAARNAVLQSLLKAALLEEIAADADQPAWRMTNDGERIGLRVTSAGLNAIASGESAEASRAAQSSAEEAQTADTAEPPNPVQAGMRLNLRTAAQALLTAWDEDGRPALPDAVACLRAALVKAPRGRQRAAPRANTKQAAVLALLRRPEGASGPAIAEATGWAPHTVRGFLAGLAKKGIKVTVLERVRQVGPRKEGAKGSYTVYRVVEVS